MSDTQGKNERALDVLVWGATGYTGRLVADYLARRGSPGLRWGIAGRSQEKLEEVRRALARDLPELAALPIVLADASDPASLRRMAAQTRALCTTVGPFALHGSALVAACVQEKTHYADITGEVQWVRRMIDQHHDEALDAGVRIVHCCGFDSIPSDLGAQMMVEHLRDVHRQETASVRFVVGPSRGGFSGGTVASLLNVFEEAVRDPSLRRLLADPYSLDPLGSPKSPPSPDQRGPVLDPDLRCWTAPFLMAPVNTRIVRRSNALLGRAYGPSFVYGESMLTGEGTPGRLAAAALSAALVASFGAFAVPPVRAALRRFVLPAQGDGPSEATREQGFFRGRLVAVGDRGAKVRGRVGGQKDPGYAETAKMLAESVQCLALDQQKLTDLYGVLTPASAMGKTLRERLVRAGMTFEVEPLVSPPEPPCPPLLPSALASSPSSPSPSRPPARTKTPGQPRPSTRAPGHPRVHPYPEVPAGVKMYPCPEVPGRQAQAEGAAAAQEQRAGEPVSGRPAPGAEAPRGRLAADCLEVPDRQGVAPVESRGVKVVRAGKGAKVGSQPPGREGRVMEAEAPGGGCSASRKCARCSTLMFLTSGWDPLVPRRERSVTCHLPRSWPRGACPLRRRCWGKKGTCASTTSRGPCRSCRCKAKPPRSLSLARRWRPAVLRFHRCRASFCVSLRCFKGTRKRAWSIAGLTLNPVVRCHRRPRSRVSTMSAATRPA
ncbi:MAG: saccharopine dehydrogenase NADP-binding domain-containing protein [Polyangiaceae bacterium]|nr:saccharopine dehydrogenase NADP-binding domain-containing protein [Polyangiaceae bacterium]